MYFLQPVKRKFSLVWNNRRQMTAGYPVPSFDNGVVVPRLMIINNGLQNFLSGSLQLFTLVAIKVIDAPVTGSDSMPPTLNDES